MQQSYFLVAQVVVSVLLIMFVLLQQKGSGLGNAFGGEGNVYRSRRGVERSLFSGTIVLGIVYAVIAALAVFYLK